MSRSVTRCKRVDVLRGRKRRDVHRSRPRMDPFARPFSDSMRASVTHCWRDRPIHSFVVEGGCKEFAEDITCLQLRRAHAPSVSVSIDLPLMEFRVLTSCFILPLFFSFVHRLHRPASVSGSHRGPSAALTCAPAAPAPRVCRSRHVRQEGPSQDPADPRRPR